MSGGTGSVATGLPAARALSSASNVAGPTRPSTSIPEANWKARTAFRGWAHDTVEIELGIRSQPVEAVLEPDAVTHGFRGRRDRPLDLRRRAIERDGRVELHHGQDQAGHAELGVNLFRVEHSIGNILAFFVLVGSAPDIGGRLAHAGIAKAIEPLQVREYPADAPVLQECRFRSASDQSIDRGILERLERATAGWNVVDTSFHLSPCAKLRLKSCVDSR
jgi:hypothetical protein